MGQADPQAFRTAPQGSFVFAISNLFFFDWRFSEAAFGGVLAQAGPQGYRTAPQRNYVFAVSSLFFFDFWFSEAVFGGVLGQADPQAFRTAPQRNSVLHLLLFQKYGSSSPGFPSEPDFGPSGWEPRGPAFFGIPFGGITPPKTLSLCKAVLEAFSNS